MSSFIRRRIGHLAGGGEELSRHAEGSETTVRGCHRGTGDLVVTSTGVPSFDALFAEGVPLGTALAILEDWPRSTSNYCSSLVKCVISEGLTAGHHVFMIEGVALSEANALLASLPSPSSRKVADQEEQLGDTEDAIEEKMTIAWRYKHLRRLDGEDDEGGPLGVTRDMDALSLGGLPRSRRAYDLGRRMDVEGACRASKSQVEVGYFADENLAERIGALALQARNERTALRIVFRSFASPIMAASFGGSTEGGGRRQAFEGQARLLYRLRRVLAAFGENAVLFLTIPAYLYSGEEDAQGLNSVYIHCDGVVALQSFVGTAFEGDRTLGDYLGFLKILRAMRMPRSLAVCMPESTNMAFKVRRRSLLFEPFIIPPEAAVDEATERSARSGRSEAAHHDDTLCITDGGEPSQGAAMGCGGSSSMDF